MSLSCRNSDKYYCAMPLQDKIQRQLLLTLREAHAMLPQGSQIDVSRTKMSWQGGSTYSRSAAVLQSVTKLWKKGGEGWTPTGSKHQIWHLKSVKNSGSLNFPTSIDLSISSLPRKVKMRTSWISKDRATLSHKYNASTNISRTHCQRSSAFAHKLLCSQLSSRRVSMLVFQRIGDASWTP